MPSIPKSTIATIGHTKGYAAIRNTAPHAAWTAQCNNFVYRKMSYIACTPLQYGPFAMWAQTASFVKLAHSPTILRCDTYRLESFSEVSRSRRYQAMIDGRGISETLKGRENSICAIQIEQFRRGGLRRPCAGMSQAQATTDETKLSSCQEDVRRQGKAIDGLSPSVHIVL